MKPLSVSALLLLFLFCGTFRSSAGKQKSKYKNSDWSKTLSSIKGGIQKIHTYYTYYKYAKNVWDLFQGSDELCQFKCPDAGEKPFPRLGYSPLPNGCGTPLSGFHTNIRIPLITSCCDQHDRCYGTCGRSKHDCDERFQVCLMTICRNLLNMLGLDQSVQECELGVNLIFEAIVLLGCEPYKNSQRAACICHSVVKTDL